MRDAGAGAFLGMWSVTMVPMMLPALVPALWRYRRAVVGAGGAHPALPTGVAGAGYVVVWIAFGLMVFPVAGALAHVAPTPAGVVVLAAGAVQLTGWKARRLAACRRALGGAAGAGSAWRHGIRLGLRCGASCANLMAILFVMGMMDWRVMAAVGAAIAAERVGPGGARIARATGVVAIGAGLILLARAALPLGRAAAQGARCGCSSHSTFTITQRPFHLARWR